MQELKGLAALVTGGGKNIGRAIALDLADGGADVAIFTRADISSAKSVAGEIETKGVRSLALLADVTDEEAVKRAMEQTLAAFGRLDILVNNASIRPEVPLENMTLDAWHQVLAVTLDGAFLCARAALPALEKSGQGAIINIGGLTAYTGAIHRAHVVTAKAGLDGLTKALALELAPKGITVNLVSPGMIATVRGGSSAAEPEHHKTRTTLVGRRGRPEEVSGLVRYLAGPKARYLTGQTLHVNGGAFLP